MASTRKATFSISETVLAQLDAAVARGAARSKNALVERALANELRELRRQEMRARWEEALGDPLFARDLEEIEQQFGQADAESVSRVD